MTSEKDAIELLDVRGLLCPIPVIRTAARMRDFPPGARLEVVGDDPAISEDMPVWCERTGNALISIERDGALVRCVVEKRG
jgi:tRNA 2-thiouridine synthesizing protein A